MNLIDSLIEFIKTLTLVDIVFFVAVVLLIILIVTLIYFIKINSNVIEYKDDDNHNDKSAAVKEIENIVENLKEENVKQIEYDDEEGELLDLNSLTKKLEQQESERVDVTEYEKDQEEKAIISYDELVAKHHNYAINYDEEKTLDDVVVKKVNLTNLVNQNSEEYNVKDVKLLRYANEEAFLDTLKELNRLLN